MNILQEIVNTETNLKNILEYYKDYTTKYKNEVSFKNKIKIAMAVKKNGSCFCG